MTAELRAPAAIRITRPYSTEDEYLEHELDTLTRASITLVGAQPRAEGAVLRFELVLASGQVLLRGEGRVTGFKPNALNGLGGLALRFTRLDTRSKALVDRAAALRERRRPPLRSPGSDPPTASLAFSRASVASIPPEAPAEVPSSPARPSSSPPGMPLPAARPSSSPPGMPLPAARPSSNPPGMPLPAARPSPIPESPPEHGSSPPSPPPSSLAFGAAGRPAAPASIGYTPGSDPMKLPADREALLERLRARARKLDPAMVRRLLALRGST